MHIVEQFEGKAPKVKLKGLIRYNLWTNDQGALYVQMFENDVDTEHPGTLNNYLFPIAEHIHDRCSDSKLDVTQGLSVDTLKLVNVKNNNTSAFLKAVLRQLFPCQPKT